MYTPIDYHHQSKATQMNAFKSHFSPPLTYLLVGFSAFSLLSLIASADPIIVSTVAPTPDADDISMLNPTGQYDIGGNQGHIWSNRPVQVQTFTTGSNAQGYLLHAVTLQNLNNTITSSPTFTLRVGTVSGTTFNELSSVTGTAPSYTSLNYLTFDLDTPVSLLPDTLYGFDWGSNGQGFVTVNNADSNYTGGSAFSSGSSGVGDANLILHNGPNTGGNSGNGDRIFHLDISTTIPEPSSGTLALLGIFLLIYRWHQR